MTTIPDDRSYTKEHEWLLEDKEAGVFAVGITAFAQDELGEVVYVEFPDVGDEVTAGESFGVVESTKAASDIYAPISGTVAAVNAALEDEPSLINSAPYGDGWLIKIKAEDGTPDGLLDSEAYKALIS